MEKTKTTGEKLGFYPKGSYSSEEEIQEHRDKILAAIPTSDGLRRAAVAEWAGFLIGSFRDSRTGCGSFTDSANHSARRAGDYLRYSEEKVAAA